MDKQLPPLSGMAIANLNYFSDLSRQLYRIRFGRTAQDEDRDVYLLGESLEDVIDMFPAYFWTGKVDPKEIKPCSDDDEIAMAKQEIRAVERVTPTVLARY